MPHCVECAPIVEKVTRGFRLFIDVSFKWWKWAVSIVVRHKDMVFLIKLTFPPWFSHVPAKLTSIVCAQKFSRKKRRIQCITVYMGTFINNVDLLTIVQVNNYEIVVNYFHIIDMIFSNCPWIYQNLSSLFKLWTDKTIHVNLCKNCPIDLIKNTL